MGLKKSVFSFQSAVYFAVLKLEFIIRALTNSQGRRMHSYDKRSSLTSANTCVPPFFAGGCPGSPDSVGFRWDFEFISQCIKINKTRPKFHFFSFFLTKIEISCLFPVLLTLLTD